MGLTVFTLSTLSLILEKSFYLLPKMTSAHTHTQYMYTPEPKTQIVYWSDLSLLNQLSIEKYIHMNEKILNYYVILIFFLLLSLENASVAWGLGSSIYLAFLSLSSQLDPKHRISKENQETKVGFLHTNLNLALIGFWNIGLSSNLKKKKESIWYSNLH